MAESVESSDCEFEGSPTILPPTPPRHRGSSGAKRQLLPSLDPFSATSTSRLNKENRSVEVSNTISLHTGDSSHGLTSKDCEPQNPSQVDLLHKILEEVRKNGERMTDLEERVKKVETDEISSKPAPRKKKSANPSPQLRAQVRKVYKALKEEEDEDFAWDTGKKFSAAVNQDVLKRLVNEVKAVCPDTPSALIKEAAHTYFESVSGKERMQGSGKYWSKCEAQRKKNRKERKLNRRRTALQKTKSLSEEVKAKWKPCMVLELISSEESEWEEDNDGNTYKMFYTHPLPWRGKKVNDVFNALDRKARKDASQKSHMMTFSRLEGLPSDRAKPEGLGLPNWVFKQASV